MSDRTTTPINSGGPIHGAAMGSVEEEEAKTIDIEITRAEALLNELRERKRAGATLSVPSIPSLPTTPFTPTPESARRHGVIPSVPPAPVSAAQPTQVNRALGFHTTNPLRAPQARASPATPEVAATTFSHQRPLKGKEPEKFGGSEHERVGARRWLRTARNWLKLAARGEDEATMVDMFATLLKDAAGDWFYHLQEAAERRGEELALQFVFEQFVLKFEGGVSRVLLQQELDNLVYRRGKCKDIYATDAEFDRLVGMLYPDLEDDAQSMPLLAKVYSDIFRRGDVDLWTEALRMQPETVNQWKVAIQKAYTLLQILATAPRAMGRGGYGGGRPYSSSPSPSSSSGTFASMPHRNPGASVNEMQGRTVGDEEKGETYTWERKEGEEEQPPYSEQLQQVAVKRGPAKAPASAPTGQRGQGGEPFRRFGDHLSAQERAALVNVGRCFNCSEKGHVARRCPSLDKPGFPKKPRAEQLKE
jgi:hypothetical protein